MNQQLPRIALVLLVAASLTISLAGARAISDIIGPTVLALVLTITVHPVRRRLVRRGLPEWLAAKPACPGDLTYFENGKKGQLGCRP